MAPILSRFSSTGGGGIGGFGFGKRKVAARFSATGGNVDGLEPGNGYKYHTFTSPGTFTVSSLSTTAEILLVAGGGGGGPSRDSQGAGGGAGGLIYWNSIPLTPGSYPVTIGPGGNGGQNNGTPTVFAPGTPLHLVALGGGYAGGGIRNNQYPGSPGGSGGGGAGFAAFNPNGDGIQTTDPTIPTNSRTYGFGFAGHPGVPGSGGGGGGAGEAGSTDGVGFGGDGRQYPDFTGPLIGVPALSPLSGYFAGGGNAGGSTPPAGAGLGGGGEAGNGAPGGSGVTNSGGGGGGSYSSSPANIYVGGAGGSGIVIIRYLA